MKITLLIFILISNYILIYCDGDYQDYEGNPDNINIESISYELTYSNNSVVKVVIKTYDEIDNDVSFIAYLKSYVEQKEYILNCSSTFYDIIECFSEKKAKFNINDKFYFYYNKTKSKFTLDENDVLEDDKHISLVFKPEITIDNKLYKDNRKFTVDTEGKMIGGGYLYITRKSKDALNNPKNGFNKYIEINNLIPKVGFFDDIPLSTLAGYKEAIKRGYHIVDAVLRFTSDKIGVISHEEDLEKISDGKGKISSYTYNQLLELDFGSKIDKKYKGEKILSLQILLQLCKELNVIVDLDLSQLDNEKYFKNNTYAYRLLNIIEKYDMFDSVYFSDGPSASNILKLKEIKNDISVSILNVNIKDSLDKIKTKFAGSKKIILSSGEISYGNSLNEENIKYASKLGQKIKVGIVDDRNYAHKIQSWGVNFITTKSLPSFLIQNDKEDPIIVRCVPIDDDNSECEIEDDVILKDNEWYNIYYSENIYNLSQNINSEPIGEFQYVDTNILDELYYKINKFNFDRGIINLNLSQKLRKGEEIFGIVGPDYDDVPECYQYNFICEGQNTYTVDCKIQKEEEEKIEYKGGNYCIYSLEDYSLNEYETDERTTPEETYIEYIADEKKRPYVIVVCIVIVIIICLVIIYLVKFRKKRETYDRIRISDNNYLSDNYLYRY